MAEAKKAEVKGTKKTKKNYVNPVLGWLLFLGAILLAVGTALIVLL